MAREEGGAWGAMAEAGGAGYPGEIAPSICDEEETLGRGTEMEGDEVLAGARGCGGVHRKLGMGKLAEGGEEGGKAVVVGGEGLRWRWRVRIFMEEW